MCVWLAKRFCIGYGNVLCVVVHPEDVGRVRQWKEHGPGGEAVGQVQRHRRRSPDTILHVSDTITV